VSLKVIENSTIRKLEYAFIFAFHSNYGSNLHHFGDEACILVENRDFFIPPCIRCPSERGPRQNIAIMFGK